VVPAISRQRGDPAPPAQTPLCAERFDEAFGAGTSAGVFQVLHCGHDAALA
jgi:acyl-CoA reductase-like NAD-dependent aldehyde dehydrogenase